MADEANATPACNLVAIDIARYWNAVLIETPAGKQHRFRMANTAPDIDRLLKFLHGRRAVAEWHLSRPVIITVRLPTAC